MPDRDLVAFIDELRARLERGDFRGHPPLQLDAAVSLPEPERAIAIMLAEVITWRETTLSDRVRPWNLTRQRLLAQRLRLLRDRLAGLPPPPKPPKPY